MMFGVIFFEEKKITFSLKVDKDKKHIVVVSQLFKLLIA